MRNPTYPTFATEKEAVQYLRALLLPYFWVVGEVWLTHPDGKLRADLMAIPRKETFPAAIVAIEVKRGYGKFKGFGAAIKQAIDYRLSTITDTRARKFKGRRPDFAFVYPCLEPAHEMHSATDGALWVAARFNVGTIVEDGETIDFMHGGSRLWTNNSRQLDAPTERTRDNAHYLLRPHKAGSARSEA